MRLILRNRLAFLGPRVQTTSFLSHSPVAMNDITRVLAAAEQGDPCAAELLLPLVYEELRRLAAQWMAREAPGQTLQPTSLVHEAYLRLVARGGQYFNSRAHFFGAAAEAMRRILVENARRKACLKRGGALGREPFPDSEPAAPERSEDLLALDEALSELTVADAQSAELVKLRYFAGLTSAEAAEVLGISPRTADRIWVYARVWLRDRLQQD